MFRELLLLFFSLNFLLSLVQSQQRERERERKKNESAVIDGKELKLSKRRTGLPFVLMIFCVAVMDGTKNPDLANFAQNHLKQTKTLKLQKK